MASSDNYTPILPSNHSANKKIKDFIERFYAVSDDRSKNEEWVNYFLPDATVIIGDRSAKGTDEIRRLRHGMWEDTELRLHRPEKVFPASFDEVNECEGDIEYMLQGLVYLISKNGKQRAVSWAGRAVLNEVQGTLKYRFYQVFLRG
ncbi:hypothetical protein F4805DRAFT_425391 [Annulohypoxylon moriforme]|nr:hypothetical protein F4805DRAFT_425391 [Annulohypoxylon moriforme]